MNLPYQAPAALPAPPLPKRGQALFLDVDGTLCDIALRPADVGFDAGLRRLLDDLSERLDGAIALVSGRPLAWLAAESGPLQVALAGTHGLELRHADGRVTMAPLRPGLAPALAAARHFAAVHLGVLIEAKARGIAIHYRVAPERAGEVAAFAQDLARRHDLPLQHGKMVVELKGGDGDKGKALATLMAEPPFAGQSPVYVGDDLTDEAAFEAAAAAGGYGVLVGGLRPTAATFQLADPAAVRAWLATTS